VAARLDIVGEGLADERTRSSRVSQACDEWMDNQSCSDAVALLRDAAQYYSQLCACHRVDCGNGRCQEAAQGNQGGCSDEFSACEADGDCHAIIEAAPRDSPPDEATCNANTLCAAAWACMMGSSGSSSSPEGSCICDEGWGGERCDQRLCDNAQFVEFISAPPTVARYSAVKADSGEESVADGTMIDLGRSDLDLMRDGRRMQLAAIRFRSVELPGADDLADAHIIFDVKRVAQGGRRRAAEEPVTIEIAAELSTASAAISADDFDLSTRTKTTARVYWDPPPPTREHEELVTPNLAPLLAEIAAMPGYSSGSAVTIIFTHARGTGVRWVETESENLGIDTPSLMVSSGSRPASPNVWAALRGPAMRQNCGRVLAVVGGQMQHPDEAAGPDDDRVWSQWLCDCFTQVSPQEADEQYHCVMPGARGTVYDDWRVCQDESIDPEAVSEACPFTDADGSPCGVEACTRGTGAHATEQCCGALNRWCATSSDSACGSVPALCDEFLPTGVQQAVQELHFVCSRELAGCARDTVCKTALETFLSPLDTDPTAVLQLQIRGAVSRKMQRLALCAVQADLPFLAPGSPCDTFPCQHQGVCREDSGASSGFTCACKPGWAGTTCEIDIDECASSPCENGGACEHRIDSFKCSCLVGFRGETCAKSAQPAKTTMGGASGISPEEFLSALTSTSTLTAGDIEITSATYTVDATVQLPVPFPEESSEEGQAARLQFREGIAAALGLTTAEQVEITGTGRRMLSEADLAPPVFTAPPQPVQRHSISDHKMKFLSPKLQKRKLQRAQEEADRALVKAQADAAEARLRRLQSASAVDYSITAEDDLSSSLQTADLATAINDAGDALAPVNADDLAVQVSNVETEITFDVVSDDTTGSSSNGTSAGSSSTAPNVAAMDNSALASALGAEVAVEELPVDVCTAGLTIDNSDRHIANACSGAAGATCEYTCDPGYAKTTASTGHSHTCGGDGAFSGGECLPIGSVVCPDTWTALTAQMVVGYDSSEQSGLSLCDAVGVDTDSGMPTTTIEEVVLAAQEKWSHCLSTISIASVVCNGGEVCAAEFEIGSTTVELLAVDTEDMSEASCSFEVTVTDNEPPTIDPSSCPDAMVATKSHPVWPTIISEDNSGDVEVVPSVGGAVGAEELTAANAPTGQNKIVFTASDASGNTASCGAIFGLW
jgi:hypothetical protein